ncbi:S-adenosyl-L-methionine-dependent methyltransferase [Flammula alnicola]|nr:S-adenosyl-L-methionine-dependent methyltransferase [Flammula alnicola]
MSTSAFQPSKLGTKEHWDTTYEEELENFEEIGDEGEIWFGEESVEKMVDWTLQNLPPSAKASILEVGSGNGTLLFGLLEAGYDASTLHGIDYSAGAIKLSKEISKTRGGSEITFSECDFLNDAPQAPEVPHEEGQTAVWDLLLDKGTYDAIALGEKDEQGNSPAIRYPSRVTRCLKSGGHFLITSCNFTEEELKASFDTEDSGLVYHSRIQHPTFSYGGKSGSVCSSVAFRKK